MMTAIPNPPSRQIDPFERDRVRLARYRELRDFYDGGQWLGRPRRGEKRLVVNYARALVRKVVSYVLPSRVGFAVPVPALEAEGGRREGDGEPLQGPDLVRSQGETDE